LPKLQDGTPAALLSNDSTMVDVVQRLGYRPVHGREATFFAGFPGNQLLTFAVQRKSVRLPTLPPELDGLTIAHLSDMHMTGKVGREYYEAIIDETNALDPDFVCITGDIVEKETCLPWIGPTLGQLRPRHGKFFVLGNHEKRLADVPSLRAMLTDVGLTDLGSRSELLSIRGTEVLLAGNELPWFGSAPDISHSADPLRGYSGTPSFRILLAHTPDLLLWARSHQFDLMLAGHNHGGQIRLPYLGALITPSVHGFRYAGGLYDEPPTLLHVSSGLGGIHPIRLNCPPELALLVLKRD
jgi:predicted MPP superfamily phosphohydrolase